MKELALYGGTPVRRTMLPYGHQWIDEDDIRAVVEVLRGEWITQGPTIETFERAVARYCGTEYAVAMSSGTAALHAAYLAAGIGPGHEIITTPLTFAATANAALYCGARPVLADIHPDTLTIDSAEARRRISSKTKAIVPVDFAGLPAILDEDLHRLDGCLVIRDAAHSLGARYQGRRVGELADMTVLSFHPVKHITTGEGGMVLTNDAELAERLRRIRHHGIVRAEGRADWGAWYYEVQSLGYNYRLTDLQSALGLSQLKKLDRFIARRREIAGRYNEAFRELGTLVPQAEPDGYVSAYHIYVVRLVLDRLTVDRRTVFDALRAEGIGVHVHYIPVHLHPLYRSLLGYEAGDYPVAESYYRSALTLPLFPAMTDQDVNDVIEAVWKVLTYFKR